MRICDCSGFRNISVDTGPGEIASHSDTSSSRHGNSLVCSWQINVPRGKRVVAWFVYIDLEEDFDFVMLFDGSSNSKLIAKVSKAASARFESPRYVSTGNAMTVVFSSDNSIAGFGFRLHYETTESNSNGSCQRTPISSLPSNGLIKSHNGFGRTPYAPNTTCFWRLPMISGRFIHLTLMNLSLAIGDSLSLIGGWIGGRLRSRTLMFRDWAAISEYNRFASGSVEIKFQSDGRLESTGFVIHYRYDEYCDGRKQLTVPEGEIETHSGIGFRSWLHKMLRPRTCSWTISQTPGNRITVQFARLSFSSRYDQIKLSDGLGKTFLSLDSSSNLTSILQTNFITNYNKVTVFFKTWDYNTASGFRLAYSTSNDFCHKFRNVSANHSGGDIESHVHAEVQHHTHRMRCTWEINAPRGKRIVAWFDYIDLEKGYDFVTLFDGINGSQVIAKVSQRASANYASPKYISTSSVLAVFFSTDDSVENYGFRLHYEVSESPKNHSCGSTAFENRTSGLITSHVSFGKTPYSSNMSCEWSLPAMAGHFIELTLLNTSLGGGDCVWLVDGARICGWYRPRVEQSYWATSSTACVRFQSDLVGESTGFQIRFQYTPQTKLLKSETGQIVSHRGFPAANYATKMQRNWEILAPPGRQIFAWFRAGTVSLGSSNDTITVHDSWRSQIILLRGGFDSATNKLIPGVFYTSSNMMRVSFSTGDSIDDANSHGFQLEYTWAESFCHGFKLVTETKGELLISHTGVNKTHCLNNMKCDWQIVSPPGTRIEARFTYLALESVYDFVNVSDGYTSQLLARALGGSNFTEPVIVSSSNVLLVSFRTGSSNGGSRSASLGFQLRYRYESINKYCTGVRLYLNQAKGAIASHTMTGRAIYPIEAYCFWQIVAPRNHRVFARFTYLGVNATDMLAAVVLRDGGFKSTILASIGAIKQIGNITSSSVFVSSGNTMTVYFNAKRNSKTLGFRLVYNTTEYFCERYQVLSDGSGEIVSHSGVGVTPYLNNMLCEWLILGQADERKLCSEISYICLRSVNDTVTVLDGVNGSVITTVKGDNRTGWQYKPAIFCTASGVMTVIFSTDGTGTSLGFRLKYRSIAQGNARKNYRLCVRWHGTLNELISQLCGCCIRGVNYSPLNTGKGALKTGNLRLLHSLPCSCTLWPYTYLSELESCPCDLEKITCIPDDFCIRFIQ